MRSDSRKEPVLWALSDDRCLLKMFVVGLGEITRRYRTDFKRILRYTFRHLIALASNRGLTLLFQLCHYPLDGLVFLKAMRLVVSSSDSWRLLR